MTDFQLTDGERSHPLWKRLEAHLVDQLASVRAKNDDASLNEQQTAALRGRIHCLKGLIALGADRPITTGD